MKATSPDLQPSSLLAQAPDDAHPGDRPPWLNAELFPFRSRFLEVDGAKLHYVDEGRGPVILMLHGSPLWSFMYRHLITALRPHYRCIAVDLPGMGLSQAPIHRGEAFAYNARWLELFVRKLQLDEMTVMVHATAGPSALLMATRIPERVSRLVISNSFAWSLRSDPKLRRIVAIVSSGFFGFLTVHLNFLARITARKARRIGTFSEAERQAVLGPFRSKRSRRHLRNILYSVRQESPLFEALEAQMGKLRSVPTLFIYGGQDNGYRAGFLDRWKALLPIHRALVLEDAGHFPLEDAPGRIAEELADWL